MIENGGHVTPVPSPHHAGQRQQHTATQPTNDTAFPGAPLRHSYAIATPGQGQETHTILATISASEIKEPKQV